MRMRIRSNGCENCLRRDKCNICIKRTDLNPAKYYRTPEELQRIVQKHINKIERWEK